MVSFSTNIRLHWHFLRLSIFVNAVFLFAYLCISLPNLSTTLPSVQEELHARLARRSFSLLPALAVQEGAQVVQQVSAQLAVTAKEAQCDMCSVAPELCAEVGEDKLKQAVSYGGTNARLKRALAKMRSGEPWVMGVIGGSGTST